jgi:hypothetical protein
MTWVGITIAFGRLVGRLVGSAIELCRVVVTALLLGGDPLTALLVLVGVGLFTVAFGVGTVGVLGAAGRLLGVRSVGIGGGRTGGDAGS